MNTCQQCATPILKKEAEHCRECGAILCASHAYSYVDGNNGAITRNSPTLCRPCYEKRHGPSIRIQPAWPKPAPDLTIEPFDTERARRAHAHISFSPEQRARTERAAFYRFTSDVLQKAQEMAHTAEQRAIMHREFAAFYRGYQQRLYAYLDAKSRTMSTMIAGPANFPTRRNQKQLDIEDKRLNELHEWLPTAQKRLYAAIERARTPEQITADRFARLKVEIDRAMTTAAAIDAGTMPGFNRQAFTTSISGMLKRLAANGETEVVSTALAYIREHQATMPRPFFTDRNSVWRLV